MTLNTARRIEFAFQVVTGIIALPFIIIVEILKQIERPFNWVIDKREWLAFKVGNKLMRMSDAVKDGTIRNKYCLKFWTAQQALEQLEEKNEQEKMKKHEEDNV